MYLPPRKIRCTQPEDTKPRCRNLRELHGFPRLSPTTTRLRGGNERSATEARVTSPPESPERGRDGDEGEPFFSAHRAKGKQTWRVVHHAGEEKVGPTGIWWAGTPGVGEKVSRRFFQKYSSNCDFNRSTIVGTGIEVDKVNILELPKHS